jgi:hypothetical protein
VGTAGFELQESVEVEDEAWVELATETAHELGNLASGQPN